MRLVSVNAGSSELMKIGARIVETGIRKGPVERGHVGTLGLAGDVVADEENHGGPDQAIYLYSSEDYAWWADELGGLPEPGTFGENLTLSSFGAEPVRIGDRFQIGPNSDSVLVEATAPRIPCSVFATRMGEPNWVKRFADARRPGLYVRVLRPGEVAAGDPVERLGGGEGHPTVVDLMDVWYDVEPATEQLERLLASPLAVRARGNVETKLAKLV
ncbi:MAG: MOSC domain-containing protein [Actinomycetota bacterium]|nr:MOSC domain-containing protein [Actinomycetota bacterium]